MKFESLICVVMHKHNVACGRQVRAVSQMTLRKTSNAVVLQTMKRTWCIVRQALTNIHCWVLYPSLAFKGRGTCTQKTHPQA